MAAIVERRWCVGEQALPLQHQVLDLVSLADPHLPENLKEDVPFLPSAPQGPREHDLDEQGPRQAPEGVVVESRSEAAPCQGDPACGMPRVECFVVAPGVPA